MIHRTIISPLIALTLVATSGAAAKAAQPPAIIQRGLAAYAEKGAEAALQAWIAGSPLENDKMALSQANLLRQIESFYGSYKDYESIGIKPLGRSTAIHYLVLKYEKGPLFCSFVIYTTAEEEIMHRFDFNTIPREIMPPAMLVPETE